jgi:soluble lytic murein transglycosylase-like protein
VSERLALGSIKVCALSCRKIFDRPCVGFVALFVGILIHDVAFADVWKLVDANGEVQFTNQAPSKNSEVVIESNPTKGEPSVAARFLPGLPDAAASTTVDVINASPAYRALHGSLSAASQAYGVDYHLLKAVVAAESAFNSKAISAKGAVGLMQVMPATASRYGVQADRGASITAKLTDPDLNIQTGTRYLADLLRLFGGQTELALAAYNAGEGAVVRAGNRVPDYKETQSYVQRVMAVYRLLQIRV